MIKSLAEVNLGVKREMLGLVLEWPVASLAEAAAREPPDEPPVMEDGLT